MQKPPPVPKIPPVPPVATIVQQPDTDQNAPHAIPLCKTALQPLSWWRWTRWAWQPQEGQPWHKAVTGWGWAALVALVVFGVIGAIVPKPKPQQPGRVKPPDGHNSIRLDDFHEDWLNVPAAIDLYSGRIVPLIGVVAKVETSWGGAVVKLKNTRMPWLQTSFHFSNANDVKNIKPDTVAIIEGVCDIAGNLNRCVILYKKE